jgi:hypothetical protein
MSDADALRHQQEENAKNYAEVQRLKRELAAVVAQHAVLCAHLDDIRLLLRVATER